jgi:hypothetical protein
MDLTRRDVGWPFAREWLALRLLAVQERHDGQLDSRAKH